jgi:hypothetical protein
MFSSVSLSNVMKLAEKTRSHRAVLGKRKKLRSIYLGASSTARVTYAVVLDGDDKQGSPQHSAGQGGAGLAPGHLVQRAAANTCDQVQGADCQSAAS